MTAGETEQMAGVKNAARGRFVKTTDHNSTDQSNPLFQAVEVSGRHAEARRAFLAALDDYGLVMETRVPKAAVLSKSASGKKAGAVPVADDMVCDVAWVGPRAARRVLLVASGLHGDDGLIGSAVITDWIGHGGAEDLPNTVAVLVVTASNAGGFATSQKVIDGLIADYGLGDRSSVAVIDIRTIDEPGSGGAVVSDHPEDTPASTLASQWYDLAPAVSIDPSSRYWHGLTSCCGCAVTFYTDRTSDRESLVLHGRQVIWQALHGLSRQGTGLNR